MERCNAERFCGPCRLVRQVLCRCQPSAVVVLAHSADIKAKPGSKVSLSAAGTSDPDGDSLTFSWWQYAEAGTYPVLLIYQTAILSMQC